MDVVDQDGNGDKSQSCTSCSTGGCPLCRPKILFPLALVIIAVVAVAQFTSDAPDGPQGAKKGCPGCDGAACSKSAPAPLSEPEREPVKKDEETIGHEWKAMFDGKTLSGWKAPSFGGEGEVVVKDGTIVMEMGESMTGITWTGEFPKINYEVSLEAQRVDGTDFFATTTFPVGEDFCSLVVGGWAGTVVGLSNVDYYDASDNITTRFADFKKGQWYRIRVRVTDAKIEAWIDDEKVVDLQTEGHKIDTRVEVDLCQPFGFSSWVTTGALRNIRVRVLRPEEVAAAAVKKEE